MVPYKGISRRSASSNKERVYGGKKNHTKKKSREYEV